MHVQSGKGVENVKRRTWDTAFYERQAILRASGQLPEDEKNDKKKTRSNKIENRHASEEKKEVILGVKAAYLERREDKITILSSSTSMKESKDVSGYYCKECELNVKDSTAYLDHVNSKQRKHYLIINYHYL